MPFDGVGFSANEYSQKIEAVIDLLATPERWGKGNFRTHDGRYCLRGAIRSVDRSEVLGVTVLDAIKQVTGRNYFTIEAFNDGPRTTHATVLAVLVRAQENIATGRFHKTATGAIKVNLFRRCWNRITAWFEPPGAVVDRWMHELLGNPANASRDSEKADLPNAAR